MTTLGTLGLRTTLPPTTPVVLGANSLGAQAPADAALAGADAFVRDERQLPAGYFADVNGIVQMHAGLPLMSIFSAFGLTTERKRLNELAYGAGIAPANHKLLDQLRAAGFEGKKLHHARVLLRDLKFQAQWEKASAHNPETVRSLSYAIECGNFRALEIFLKLASEMDLPSEALAALPFIRQPANAFTVRTVVDDSFKDKMATGRVPLPIVGSMEASVGKLFRDPTNAKIGVLLKLRDYGHDGLKKKIDEGLAGLSWSGFISSAQEGSFVSAQLLTDLYRINPEAQQDGYAVLASLKTTAIEKGIESPKDVLDVVYSLSVLTQLFTDFGNTNAYQSLINIIRTHRPLERLPEDADVVTPAKMVSIKLVRILEDKKYDDDVKLLADKAYSVWEESQFGAGRDGVSGSRKALYTRLAARGPEYAEYIFKLNELANKGKIFPLERGLLDGYRHYADVSRATPNSVRALGFPIMNGEEDALMALLDIAANAPVESGLLSAVAEALPAPEQMKNGNSEAHIRQFLNGTNHWNEKIANLGINKLIARVRNKDDDGSIVLLLAKIAHEWKSEKWARFILNIVIPSIDYQYYVKLAEAGNAQANLALIAMRLLLGHRAGQAFSDAIDKQVKDS